MKYLFAIITAVALLAGTSASPAAEEIPHYGMDEDGIHIQPWIEKTFNDIGEDMTTASEGGKRLLVLWEQQGCGYCKKMHEVNFRNRQIVDYINKHFYVIQLNMRGVNEVIDVDGETLSEKVMRARAAVTGSPTLAFYPTDPGDVEGKKGKAAEVFRYVGYAEPESFLNLLAFVQSEAYKTGASFLSWYKRGEGTIKLDPA